MSVWNSTLDENNNKQELEFTYKYAQIVNLIESAKTIKDLDAIVYKLLPLTELKQLLLNKLSTLNEEKRNKKEKESVELVSSSSLSLHSLYYNCIPFDEIFSDDIICSIIQYLASPTDDDVDFMYNKLPVLNRHFNHLMKEKTILYQQYSIRVSLNDDLWKKRKSVLISISHQTKSIYIIDPVGQTSGAITPPYISSKHNSKYNINFEILNLDDMNKKCPFIWYCIKKWHIISTSINANRLYSHNLYQYYNNKRVDRVNRIYYSNDFSGYVSPTDSLNADTTPTYRSNRRSSFFNNNDNDNMYNNTKTSSRMDILTENNSIMKQLLDKAAVHIKSIQIDNINNRSSKRALKNFFWLNKLFHIQSISDYVGNFYSIKNIQCLELIQINNTNNNNNKAFEILRELKQLLVIKLDLSETMYPTIPKRELRRNSNSDNEINNDDNEEKEWLITFPINVEYIQISNFSNSSNYVLNFCECKHIISILFKDSKIFEWDITSYYTKQYQSKTNNTSYRQIENCFIWPNKLHPIECILFDDGIETRCIDNWHQYFQRNSNLIPIKFIRYRIIPSILYNNNPIPTSPLPQLAYYKQFNQELMNETQSEINSNEYESNIATVDEHFSVRSTLTSVLTQSSNAIPPPTAPKLDISVTIDNGILARNGQLEEEEKFDEDIFVPITPPSTNRITKSKKLNYNIQTTGLDREISWTESSLISANCTDSGTTANGYPLEKQFSGDASLDEEEEMKTLNLPTIKTVNNSNSTKDYIPLPLTKDMLDKYEYPMIVNEDDMFEEELAIPPTRTEEIMLAAPIESIKLVKVNDILKQNTNERKEEEWCILIDDKNNNGLLWKILLINKYGTNGENRCDSFIQERISMYNQWFNMDIAKWIYNLGHWTGNEWRTTFHDIKTFATIESPPNTVFMPSIISSNNNNNNNTNNTNNNLNTTNNASSTTVGTNTTATTTTRRARISSAVNINIPTTSSTPNIPTTVPRRSATMNTSSPTVSESPSVVDSLELYNIPTQQ